MRLATVITEEGLRLHVRGGNGYVDVGHATGDARLSELDAVLAGGPETMEIVRGVCDQDGRELSEAEYGPAVPSPRRILCLGVNYLEHALEGGRPPTKWPETFVRGADSVAAPYGDLVKPALSERFDYEGELGLVIGARRSVHPSPGRARGDRRLRDPQRRLGARVAARRLPMDSGQELRCARCRSGLRSSPPTSSTRRRSADHDAQRRGDAVGQHGPDDLRHPADDRVPLVVHHPAARRRDRHRHPGWRRIRADAARSGSSPAT